jgi:hypothetical protein
MTDCPTKTHLPEIQRWFVQFSQFHKQVVGAPIRFKDGAAKYLDETYWKTIEERVRPRLCNGRNGRKRIDHHKIASTMELCIIYLEPIEHESIDRMLELNVQLALFVAKSVILAWHTDVCFDADVASCEDFDREHMAWLLMAEHEHFPIFSNAATWYFYECVLFARFELAKAGLLKSLRTTARPTIA